MNWVASLSEISPPVQAAIGAAKRIAALAGLEWASAQLR
jgi:hypothetical protein